MKIYYTFILVALLFALSNCQNTAQKLQENQAAAAPIPEGDSQVHNPEFEKNFVALFRNQTLPYQSDTSYVLGDTIPADRVIKHIFEAAAEKEFEIFKDFWGDEEAQAMSRKALEDRFINIEKNAFAVLNFGFGERIKLNDDYYSLVFHCIPTFMEGQYKYSYLANYLPSGELVDIITLSSMERYVDMDDIQISNINENGKLTRKTQLTRFGKMYEQKEDYFESAEQIFQLNEEGLFELKKEEYSAFSGNFVAENQSRFSIEQIFDEILIYYQASDSSREEEMEILAVEANKGKIEAKIPGKEDHYTIRFRKHKAEFTCKTAEGDQVLFSRSRN